MCFYCILLNLHLILQNCAVNHRILSLLVLVIDVGVQNLHLKNIFGMDTVRKNLPHHVTSHNILLLFFWPSESFYLNISITYHQLSLKTSLYIHIYIYIYIYIFRLYNSMSTVLREMRSHDFLMYTAVWPID